MDDGAAPNPLQSSLVRVAETRQGPMQVSVHAGPIQFFADQPVGLGGGNTGPTPHELVCAGLAACTVQTVRLYADRKGWPLERIEADVQETRAPGRKTHFTRAVRFFGPLDETQTARLLEIADHCPVHRTLTDGAEVTTTLEPTA
jgi:putative redox protein